MIDVQRILGVSRQSYDKLLQDGVSQEDAVSQTYENLLTHLVEILVKDFYFSFNRTLSVVRDQAKSVFPCPEILDKITKEHLISRTETLQNVENIVFMEKNKNMFESYVKSMRLALSKNEIEQFFMFYINNQSGNVRVCSKITNWVFMVGMLEAFKTKILSTHQNSIDKIG